MARSEFETSSWEDYSNLLVLVDVANIRPRLKGQKRKALQRFGDWLSRSAPSSNDRTSLAFIDQCLFDIASAAPGAIVIKYADYSLLNSVDAEDEEELRSRFQLASFDSDKIFVVNTSTADFPLLNAHFYVGGSIISQDGFKDDQYAELVNEDTRVFAHRFHADYGTFEFVRRDGVTLQEWWSENNSFITGEWLASDEYLELEFRLRHRVKEVTWEWIDEGLTFNPEVPEEVVKRVKEGAQGSRRLPKTKRSTRRPRKAVKQEVEAFDDSQILEISEPFIEFEFSQPRKRKSIAYLLADDFYGMRKNIGEYVTVVGRVVTEDSGVWLQWLPGTEAVEILGSPFVPSDIGNSYVQLDGTLEVSGSHIALRTDEDEMFTVVTYAHIRDERNSQSRQSRDIHSRPSKTWQVPSVVDALRTFIHAQKLLDVRRGRAAINEDGPRRVGELHRIRTELYDQAQDEVNPEVQVADTGPQTLGEQGEGSELSDIQLPEQDHAGWLTPSGSSKETNPPDNLVDLAKQRDGTSVQNGEVSNEEKVEPPHIWAPPIGAIEEEVIERRKWPVWVGLLVVAVLTMIVMFLISSSRSTDESDSTSDSVEVLTVQTSVAEWRYFESVVWRK